MTTGYLFKDNRDEERPFVLFLEGLEVEEDEEDEPETIEVRFADFAEMISTMNSILTEIGEFNVEFGEPEHFENVREG